MGNSVKKPTDVKVHIYTDRTVYNSGSAMRGVVMVDALENFVTESLHIRIIGTGLAVLKEPNGANGWREAHITTSSMLPALSSSSWTTH
jgi:hypothetical protein